MAMPVFGLVGWSGSGKTTLMERLLRELVSRGLRVSTFKHAHHGFDIDAPGKDSHRHREAGATEVLIASAGRWALLHESRGEPEPDVDRLVERMTPVDLLLIEGFKRHRFEKLEVHRPSLGKPLMQPGEPTIVAVASDAPVEGATVPVLDLGDPRQIADFVLGRCGIRQGG
jgi:molybdopterin-guanine dinucleotide biosynthesis protein B